MNIGEADNWEYVMLDTVVFGDEGKEKADGDEEDEEGGDDTEDKNGKANGKKPGALNVELEEKIKNIAQMLDMPPPWPLKLYIDKLDFLRGSPMGEVTRFYKKSRLDSYTDYRQIDGLVKRLTIYEDYKRTIVTEIRYLFDHRKDNLRLRRRFPFEYRTVGISFPPNNQNFSKKTINRSSPTRPGRTGKRSRKSTAESASSNITHCDTTTGSSSVRTSSTKRL
jgi:hypothetical protein